MNYPRKRHDSCTAHNKKTFAEDQHIFCKGFYNLIRFRNIYNLLYISDLPPPMTDFNSQPREVVRLIALFVFAGGYHIYLYLLCS